MQNCVMNNSETWLRSVTDEAEGTISKRIGVYQSTLSRQLRNDNLTPENVVAIARAYRRSPLDGLAAIGLVNQEDIARAAAGFGLPDATDEDLVAEVLRRIREGGSHAAFDQSLTEAPAEESDWALAAREAIVPKTENPL